MVLLAGGAAAVAGCARDRRTPDDALVVLVDIDIDEVDPRYENNAPENKLSRLVASGLTVIDTPTLEPRLLLAESLVAEDPRTWVATLRADARFPDGSPVTADDVVFTFTSLMDEANESPKRRSWRDRLVAVEPLDDRRVRFRLHQPLATFWSDLDFGIVSRRAAAAAGAGGVRFRNGTTVGAGPYQVVSVRPGEVRLAANPYYLEGAPPVPRLIVRTVRDQSARLLMLVGGSADLAQNTVRLDLLDEVAARPRLAVVSGPSAILSYMMFQTEDPILRDARVRRALAMAIDRDKLVRKKLGGHAQLATGILPPGHWAYPSGIRTVEYDPEAAMKLLDEAGYPDPDGPGGAPRFALTYKTSSDAFRVALARQIAQMLGAIGVSVEVRSFEFATVFADIKKGNFQLASMQTAEITEPDMHWVYFHSERIPTPEFPDHGNRWRYRNSKADALIEAGRYELDREKRRAIYAELAQILADDLPIFPLWHEDNAAVVNRDVQGYAVLPHARLGGLAKTRKER